MASLCLEDEVSPVAVGKEHYYAISERSLNGEVAYRVRESWASLSPFRAEWSISLLVSRDLIEPPVAVVCFEVSGALKMFLGRFGWLRMCITELDVGLVKIGDFVAAASADDPCGLVGEPLAVTDDFL